MQLLRKSVRALAAGRHSCSDCGRTPLVGERVHIYPHARPVCALCRPRHATEPQSTELVRHSERGSTVSPAVRVA